MADSPDDKKKDLTSIIDLSKRLEETGELPDLPEGEGGSMDQTPIEKIDAFDSIEDYSKAHPDEVAEEAPEPPPPPDDSVGTGVGTESIAGIPAIEEVAAPESAAPEAAQDAAFPTT